MKEKQTSQEKRFHLFLSSEKMREIASRIRDLQAELGEKGKLSTRKQEKLEAMRGVSRREFLKKVGVGVGAIGLSALAGKKALEGLFPEKREKLEVVDALRSIIASYNAWLEQLPEIEVSKADGIKKFAELYNDRRTHVNRSEPLPEIFPGEVFDSESTKNFFTHMKVISHEMESQGYYFFAGPTNNTWKDQRLSGITAFLGRIASAESRSMTQNTNESIDYKVFIVDAIENSQDSNGSMTAQSNISAQTYHNADEQIRVMIYRPTYEVSARNIYDKLQIGSDAMINEVFARYKLRDATQGINEILDALIAVTREHEEQHVRDKVVGIKGTMLNEEVLTKWMMIEMRGLFAPLLGEYPKIALRHINSWRNSSGQYHKIIGELAWGIVGDISGVNPNTLLTVSDESIRRIGEKAMRASDIFFDAIVKNNKPMEDKLQAEYEDFVKTLHDSR